MEENMNEYIVQKFIGVDPSERGHWYECRRVQAKTKKEALEKAFPDGKVPHGYRLELA